MYVFLAIILLGILSLGIYIVVTLCKSEPTVQEQKNNNMILHNSASCKKTIPPKYKNANRILSLCLSYLQEYEATNKELSPSAKDVISPLLINELCPLYSELETWNASDEEYQRLANRMLATNSFDLLTSGKYDLRLFPMGCGSNLLQIYKKSMEYAVQNGIITPEEQEEQFDYLMDSMRSVR